VHSTEGTSGRGRWGSKVPKKLSIKGDPCFNNPGLRKTNRKRGEISLKLGVRPGVVFLGNMRKRGEKGRCDPSMPKT